MVDDCIFCKIIAGKIPSKLVYESAHTKAFLDINPMSEGHTLVVTKVHSVNLLDLPEKEVSYLFADVKKVASLLKEKLNLDGVNILQNNFPAAGQAVMHCHVHVVPRRNNDKALKLEPLKTKPTSEELDKVLAKLK